MLSDENISQIKTPMIMLLGAKDQVVDNTQSLEFYNKVQSSQKEKFVYEDKDHMLFHDQP